MHREGVGHPIILLHGLLQSHAYWTGEPIDNSTFTNETDLLQMGATIEELPPELPEGESQEPRSTPFAEEDDEAARWLREHGEAA